MSRQVVQLHTIEQWLQTDEQFRQIILKALRIRDRLWAFRLMKEQHKLEDKTSGWVPCRRCDSRGWVHKSPRKAGIHPSAMYSTCLLKIYFEAIGVDRQLTNEARELLVFDLGTVVHDIFQGLGDAGAWGPYYKAEVGISTTQTAQELGLEGHADAENILVIDDIAGAPIFEVGLVHEYKTINDNGYKNLKGSPKPAHKQQATIYSACLNRPVVVYLYMNKDNSNLQDFPIAFDAALWSTMRQKILMVKTAMDSQTPPPADVGYACNDCGYAYQCGPYQQAKGLKTKAGQV